MALDHNQWQIGTTAQAAFFLACGVEPENFERMMGESGIRSEPIPTNFAEIAQYARRIKRWVEEEQ